MLEINPVLSGKFDNWPYVQASASANASAAGASASTDLTSTASNVTAADATDATTKVDPRRYTQFDRTSTEVHTDNNMSFGDFLDMVNPLQHIPVVSSIYRAVTGDKINPISRVAGDILYGGAVGVASAVLGGLGSAANAALEESTGKDAPSTMVAALFGDDKTAVPDSDTGTKTMLADASTAPSPATTATANAAAAQSTQPAQAPAQTASAATSSSDNATVAGLRNTAKAFPLRKQPFGGVMAPPAAPGPNAPASTPSPAAPAAIPNATIASAQPTLDPQTALALNSSLPGNIRIGGTIYTGRVFNGYHPSAMPATSMAASASQAATAASASTAPSFITSPTTGLAMVATMPSSTATPAATTASTATASSSSQSALMTPLPSAQTGGTQNAAASDTTTQPTHKNPIPQALIDDMMMMKGLNTYNNAAMNRSLGATVDSSN